MPKDLPLTTFRRCVLQALTYSNTDDELRTKLTECMGGEVNPFSFQRQNAILDRQDTEPYIEGGKKSRHRRRHKSRRTRHKRKY